jgi:hypothetical protein
VRWIKSHEAAMSASAVTTTNSRSGAMPTGPRVSGAVGNGWGIDAAPRQELAVLQRDPEADHHQHGRVDRLAAQRPEQHALARRPGQRAEPDGDDEGREEAEAAEGERGERRIGAERVELTVGEVHETHETEDQGEADAEQRVRAAQHQAIHQVLQ